MTLDEIHGNLADQERGRWLDVAEPWEGKPTGLRLLIAGPDSQTQNKARIAMMDELASSADVDGRASFEARERARINCLARCVLNWDIAADFGLDAKFGHAAVVKVLQVAWIQQQVDAFAGDRANFRSAS
ncbi:MULTISPECIES: hypothetical protein [Agrobacterium]|uniref:Uncharacterized protein n=1 Tax=Agrobacterium tumefaciens TaxID=358 RepID=A0AAE6B9C9_AGRTU|nr:MULTISPECIES: hypothetical protein [Agrobacterium]QCL72717.1 hypothetical protein CFBP5499_04260 [Agrobacterium tumefaciens]QCL78292.1 hypothetical protein CFBP5877_03820 [Agrobacterium tumefaciens]CUX15272.1 conserved hypothetical protein [Agrobacterium sp. NCPPB 925]